MSPTANGTEGGRGTRQGGFADCKNTEELEKFVTEGQEATKRWFPDEEKLDRFIDGILDELKSGDNSADPSNSVGLDQSGLRQTGSCKQHLLFDEAAFAPSTAEPDQWKGTARDLQELVKHAFISMFEGRPEDHVIADPTANVEFIDRCRLLGASVSDVVLNRTLLNNRKSGKHAGIDRGRPLALGHDLTERLGFAVEIAARLVQYCAIVRSQIEPTIDKMLCAPQLRNEFDEYAKFLVPGFGEYQYRLALLSFRKSGRESSQRCDGIFGIYWNKSISLHSLDPDDVPDSPGLYRVFCGGKEAFVGHTLSLRARMIAHMRNDKDPFVPESWRPGVPGKCSVKWFESPADWQPRRTERVAMDFRKNHTTLFNLSSVADELIA